MNNTLPKCDMLADEYLDGVELTFVNKGHKFFHFDTDMICSSIAAQYRYLSHVTNKELPKKGDDFMLYSINLQCSVCGKQFTEAKINGNVVTPEADECEFKDGFPEYSVEIDIPSGKMAVANTLFPFFDRWLERLDQEHLEINSISHLAGRRNCTERAAEHNYVDMNIGNCVCDLVQVDDSKEKFIMGDVKNVDYKCVGSVRTDYWGYQIADAEELRKRDCEINHVKGNHYTKDEHSWDDLYIVDCVPGRYRFTHRYHALKDGDDPIYTIIEKVK